MKKLTTGKIWQFAAGQFGWALLSGLISNWLVYFYQPDEVAVSQGQTVFVPQGLVIFGVFTVIGGITAFGRIFDAVTDPMVASWSDRCRAKEGRRIPFLKWASFPLALSTVLVFWSPVNGLSRINGVFLFVMVLVYYFSITAYCTPYNALIPELGHTQKERLDISTVISFTFIAGTAVAYLAPVLWGFLIPALGRVNAIRTTFAVMAVIAFICMQVPVWTIREKDYVNVAPTGDSALRSLAATFRNREFCKFVGSDIMYWIGLTMFQTGHPFFFTGIHDHTLLCKHDSALSDLLCTHQQDCSPNRQEKADSLCICRIFHRISLHRLYGKNQRDFAGDTGVDPYRGGISAYGNLRHPAPVCHCGYR